MRIKRGETRTRTDPQSLVVLLFQLVQLLLALEPSLFRLVALEIPEKNAFSQRKQRARGTGEREVSPHTYRDDREREREKEVENCERKHTTHSSRRPAPVSR